MDWSTRRHVLRVYLKTHKWWWKWPFIATTVAVWVGALVLVVAPWDRAGSEEHVEGLPAPTTPDPKPHDGPTNRVSSWSTGDEESGHRRTTGTALPTVNAPAERILPEEEPSTADTDAIDRGAEVAEAAGPLESQREDGAEALDQSPRSSPPTTRPAATMGPAVTMGPTTTIGPTWTGAPPSTSSPDTTTAPASQPTLDTPGPATSTTTTTQPAVVDTTAAPTTTKATGKPGRTGPTDDEELPDTKNGKVPPGQKADKTKD
jgi:hypothetical protein